MSMDMSYRFGGYKSVTQPRASKFQQPILELLDTLIDANVTLDEQSQKLADGLVRIFNKAAANEHDQLVATLWDILLRLAVLAEDDYEPWLMRTFQLIASKQTTIKSKLEPDVYLWGTLSKGSDKNKAYIAKVWRKLKVSESSEARGNDPPPENAQEGEASRQDAQGLQQVGTSAIQARLSEKLSKCMRLLSLASMFDNPPQHPTPRSPEELFNAKWAKWAKLNTFLAKLADTGFPSLCFLGFDVIRDALETRLVTGSPMDRRLWVACEWFLRCPGQLHRCLNKDPVRTNRAEPFYYTEVVLPFYEDAALPACGELQPGLAVQSKERWENWMGRLRKVSDDSRHKLSVEAKRRAREALVADGNAELRRYGEAIDRRNRRRA